MTDTARGIEAAFPRAEFEARLTRLRTAMEESRLDAALFTGPENIFYLTGQQTPGYYTFQCLLVPLDAEPLLLLRELERTNFLRNTFLARFETYGDGARPANLVTDALQRLNLAGKPVAIEKSGWFLPIAFFEELRRALPRIEDASGLVERLRRVKSPAEVTALEQSARHADAGIAAGLAAIRAGATENDLVAEMMRAAIGAGAEYMGMEPLVSSGPRSGVPHATWRRRHLESGDCIFLEMSGCHNRYHAGLMRTGWLGEPPPLAHRLESVVQEALEAALAAARPGVACAAVHRAAQRVIDDAGMTERYRKRTGYSLGISFAPDWGEWQVLSLFDGIEVPLEPGMCFHLPTALREY
ncbi:MAG TPA: Xaa-Pro peptidase family protein, partial [Acetobacteraceae bacterium]|nr:Xaa-Pro peptidase family protein [Acetobacteraceae bacterium]